MNDFSKYSLPLKIISTIFLATSFVVSSLKTIKDVLLEFVTKSDLIFN